MRRNQPWTTRELREYLGLYDAAELREIAWRIGVKIRPGGVILTPDAERIGAEVRRLRKLGWRSYTPSWQPPLKN